MVGPGRPEFVLFGSSIVQMSFAFGGWGAALAYLYDRKADVIVRGYGGWNSRMALQVLHKIFPQGNSVQPSLVIVYFGGNDSVKPHPSGLGQHVPLSEYVENMRKIALHLKSLSSNIRIIFLTSPPVDEAMIRKIHGNSFDKQKRTNEECGEYAEALVEMCGEFDGIKAINLWKAFQHKDDWARDYLLDGIHLSSKGSKLVVKEVLRVLKAADYAPSLHWSSMPGEFPEDSPYYTVAPDGKTTFNTSNVVPRWKVEYEEELEAFASN